MYCRKNINPVALVVIGNSDVLGGPPSTTSEGYVVVNTLQSCMAEEMKGMV